MWEGVRGGYGVYFLRQTKNFKASRLRSHAPVVTVNVSVSRKRPGIHAGATGEKVSVTLEDGGVPVVTLLRSFCCLSLHFPTRVTLNQNKRN